MRLPPVRPSGVALLLLGCLLTAFVATWLHVALALGGSEAVLARNRQLVHSLMLTDLALFTEARYTRHPSQADLHTPFQDHPSAMDHFPSGSLLPPPRHLRPPGGP